MRWKEVDYLCNGLTARIRFTTAEEPEVIIEEKGVIKCAGWGYMPTYLYGSIRRLYERS